jgi:alkylation response protein AidB-like acyl-CoA dehydrogenase
MSNDWLSKAEVADLTPEILAARVRALLPFIAGRAREAELLRKPSDDVWAALRKTGIFYHFVPKRFGGLEFSIEDFVRIMLPMGAACASTTWVATFCMEHNWTFARFGAQAQEEIYGAFPYITAPGLLFPPCELTPVEGGYRANGRLKWGSGIMHADWVIGTGMVKGDKPQPRTFIVPAADARVVDVWHVDGMVGTGSNDAAFDNVFVPEHRSIDSTISDLKMPGLALHDSPIYRVPKMSFLALTAAIAPVGAALGAVDFYRSYMKNRIEKGGSAAHAERPVAQMRLGRAQIKVQTAEKLLYEAARRMTGFAEQGIDASPEQRMNLRVEIAYAVDLARTAVLELCEVAGSSAHFLDNPLQRAARDVSMMATHIIFDFDMVTEQSGRVLLGKPPTTPLL